MTVRRLNYTGRRRLRLEHVHITCSDDETRTFDADLHLDPYELPEDSRVFVEAYRGPAYMRFDFGTVGALAAPVHRVLRSFATTEGLQFRVKVVADDAHRGRLLAEADRVKAVGPGRGRGERIPLLPMRGDRLGETPWRLEYEPAPQLVVNSRLGEWRSVGRSPAFLGFVIPAAVRTILHDLLVVEEHREKDNPDDWRDLWLRWASALPGVGPLEAVTDEDGVNRWLGDVVESFCRVNRLREKGVLALAGDN